MYTKLLLLYFFLLSYSIKAQQPVLVNLTEKDGLPDIEYYNILEDSKGFIWLTADKGLYRYDGKTYKQYTNPEKRGLSVFEPIEDHLGRVWTTNISGQFFYTDQDQLITFIDLKDELNGQLADFFVTKNHLVISIRDKLYTVNLETKQVALIINKSLGLSNVLAFENQFLLLEKDSLWLYNKHFNQKRNFPVSYENFNSNLDAYQGVAVIKGLKELKLVKQRINDKNLFFKIPNIIDGTFKAMKGLELLEDLRINNFKEINNTFWFLTNKGVFVYNFVNGVFSLKKHFLNNERVTQVIVDKDLNYWITTLASGIYIIPNIEMIQYDLPVNFQNIVAINKADDSSVFFGTVNGYIGGFNLDSKQLESTAFLGNKVSSILYDATEKFSYVSTDFDSYSVDKSSYELHEIGIFNGAKSLSRISNDTTIYCTFRNVSFYSNLLGENAIITNNKRAYTTYYSEKSKTSYIGYVDNLVRLDSDLKPIVIKHEESDILAISITETADGTIWVGTFKNGVFAIKGNNVIGHYNVISGLLSNEIEYIQSDDDQLWIATSKGLQLFDSKSQKFKNLTKSDGILSYKISGIEVQDNRVVIASNKGLFSFDKYRVFKSPATSNIYFENVEVNEQPIKFSEDLSLDYYQNAIKFSFNVNGLLFNKNGKYNYRLLGYNSKWVTTATGETSVKYNSLPAGNYTFQVQPIFDLATNDNEILNLKFSIEKPFWKTWWFTLTIAILVLGSTVLYFRIKIKKKEQQRKLEIKQLSLDNELIALKLENLRSQMNPHFIFNALNSIQEYIVLNQKKLASEYLGKFADLIRIYLNHSTKGKITLQEEITCLEMYLELEKLRFEDKLHYTISTSGSLHADQIFIPTMLIQPYVENALKHGLLHRKSNRVLNINFFINDETNLVRCIIMDNGVGREQAEKFKARSYKNHESFATKATENRLALLNYGKENQVGVIITDLFDNDQPTGTQVDIKIPFTNS